MSGSDYFTSVSFDGRRNLRRFLSLPSRMENKLTAVIAIDHQSSTRLPTDTASDRIWFAQMLRAVAIGLVVVAHIVLGYWENPKNPNLGCIPFWVTSPGNAINHCAML